MRMQDRAMISKRIITTISTMRAGSMISSFVPETMPQAALAKDRSGYPLENNLLLKSSILKYAGKVKEILSVFRDFSYKRKNLGQRFLIEQAAVTAA